MSTVHYKDDELARIHGVVVYKTLDGVPYMGLRGTAYCMKTGKVIRNDSLQWVRKQLRTHGIPIHHEVMINKIWRSENAKSSRAA